MTAIKRLAGQTAIYGIQVSGRILGYLLVPLYTRVFLPGEYGTVNVFYSTLPYLWLSLLMGWKLLSSGSTNMSRIVRKCSAQE